MCPRQIPQIALPLEEIITEGIPPLFSTAPHGPQGAYTLYNLGL